MNVLVNRGFLSLSLEIVAANNEYLEKHLIVSNHDTFIKIELTNFPCNEMHGYVIKHWENCCIFTWKRIFLLQGDKEMIAEHFISFSAISSRSKAEINQARRKFLDIFDKFHPNKTHKGELVLAFLSEVYCYVKV